MKGRELRDAAVEEDAGRQVQSQHFVWLRSGEDRLTAAYIYFETNLTTAGHAAALLEADDTKKGIGLVHRESAIPIRDEK